MKFLSLVALSLAVGTCAFANGVKEKDFYGDKITLEDSVDLSKAIAHLGKDKSKEILVQAQVKKVCEKKGCWMALVSGDKTARVTFKDYGFFVPTSLQGKTILAQGQLSAETLSQGEARHFAEDGGKSKAEIKAIKGEQKEFRFVATGVQIAPVTKK